MGTFKFLTPAQAKELNELLGVADSILCTKSAVVKGNTAAATLIGSAIGGTAGAAIAASAGTAGVAAATASVLGGGALAVGGGGIALGAAAIGALPLTIIRWRGFPSGIQGINRYRLVLFETLYFQCFSAIHELEITDNSHSGTFMITVLSGAHLDTLCLSQL